MEKNLDLIACAPARYRRFSRKCSWAASKETRARGLVRSASLSRTFCPRFSVQAFLKRVCFCRPTLLFQLAWFSDVRGRSRPLRFPSLPLPSDILCARSCSWCQSTYCMARANHHARKKWSVEKSTNQFRMGVFFSRSDFWQSEDFSAMFLSYTRRTLSYLRRTSVQCLFCAEFLV